MTPDLPTYLPVKKIEPPLDPVAKSIAKPHAFAKPGSMGAKQGTRFRPLAAKRSPGRPRTRKRDPRDVKFY